MKPFEIFRTGDHRTSAGAAFAADAALLQDIADNYNASVSEAPIVVGHPKTDAPAYGWIESFSVDGDRLVAHPRQVEAQFAQMVEDGRFKKRSISLYPPTAASNPVPGTHYPRHVGFLGAAAPAISGLRDVEFAAGETVEIAVEFAAPTAHRPADFMAEDGLRDIERGLSAFQSMIWALKSFLKIGKPEPDDAAFTAAQPGPATPAHRAPAPRTITAPVKETHVDTADFQQATQKLDADRAALDRDRTEFAAQVAASRKVEDAALVDGLVEQGRIAPGARDGIVDFMATLDADDAVEFSQGKDTVNQTPRDWFRDLLGTTKPVIDFSEATADPDGGAVVTDPAAIARQAQEFQAERAAKGVEISMSEAVATVSKRTAA